MATTVYATPTREATRNGQMEARAYCSCGWYGEVRGTNALAQEDADSHDVDHTEWTVNGLPWNERTPVAAAMPLDKAYPEEGFEG